MMGMVVRGALTTSYRHRFPAPSKIAFEEHGGRVICANPSGVPVKWAECYRVLAARMYAGGPSFSIGKDKGSSVVTLMLKVGDEWLTFTDVEAAKRAIGLTDAPKVKSFPVKAVPATRVVRPGSGVPAYREIVPPSDSELPEWAEEWLGTLVYDVKRAYAREFLEHLLCGAPEPVAPAGREWADKARARALKPVAKAA